VAENCCVPFQFNETDAGATTMLVRVWLTVTLTLLVVESPLLSVIVT